MCNRIYDNVFRSTMAFWSEMRSRPHIYTKMKFQALRPKTLFICFLYKFNVTLN